MLNCIGDIDLLAGAYGAFGIEPRGFLLISDA